MGSGGSTTTDAAPRRAGRGALSPFARGHVLAAMLVLAIVLALLASQYGYHRDELYFRMLPPA